MSSNQRKKKKKLTRNNRLVGTLHNNHANLNSDGVASIKPVKNVKS